MSVIKRIVEKLDDVADKKIADVVEKAGIPPRPEPSPKPKPRDAKFARGIGERIGFAGIAAATLGAALLGAAGCRLGNDSGPARATCDEPASWCAATPAVQR